ncbi:MAG: response regulator [Gemmatimonadales bacterium]
MPRPHTVLWVDDEIESLEAHALFLEEQGYTVERAAHGDDALALLRRQAYGVVLLDEQMPGRRGLELVGEIRSIDPTVPLVMVTKSEEDTTAREAIGIAMDDYLVKPVNPRQVLTVVMRLVEGDRLRDQRLARDFVGRFRELEGRRGEAMGWREWIDLIAELAQWEVRLGAGDQEGLKDALRTLNLSLRRDFVDLIRSEYPKWLKHPDKDRPPLSVDVVSEFLAPLLESHPSVMLIVVDCLRLDQWEAIKPLIGERFDTEVSHYLSILPTATPYSRNAIFSGLFPIEIATRHPQWWGDKDDESLNQHEEALLVEQLKDLTGKPVPVRYAKLSSRHDSEEMSRQLPGWLAQQGVTALVFNFVDQLTHGRTENAILHEVARDAPALRSLTRTWFEDSHLMRALKEAERRKIPVILTSDHGSIHCHTPATVYAKRDATQNLRYKWGEDLRAEDPEAAILVDDFAAWGLPTQRLGVRMLLATEDRFFVYPTKLREYQGRYRGAFMHGGVSPEEMVLPVALLMPRAQS